MAPRQEPGNNHGQGEGNGGVRDVDDDRVSDRLKEPRRAERGNPVIQSVPSRLSNARDVKTVDKDQNQWVDDVEADHQDDQRPGRLGDHVLEEDQQLLKGIEGILDVIAIDAREGAQGPVDGSLEVQKKLRT